jgi:GH15 family glucan-1,4-alpha-glucosidase
MTRGASLELGVTGNCIISALVDREARVVWSCLPRLDGDPVFHALVDDGEREDARGFWSIELVGLERTEQEYLGNTAVLVTRLFSSNGSAVEVTDYCPRFERGGRMFRPQMLVRRVQTLAGTPRLRVRLRPSFGYGALAPEITHGSNHIRYVSPDRVLRLTTDAPVSYLLAETPFVLERSMHLVLGADETLEESPERVAREFQEETETHWRQWTRRLAIPPEWQEAVIRAAITLKLCTFEETGAIVAAMTTSIPEAPGSQRNWDYRYCWLRDAFFVVRALNSLSEVDTMEHYLRYLTNIVGQSPDGHLQPVYGIALEKRLEERATAAWARYGSATRHSSTYSTMSTATSCSRRRSPSSTGGCCARRPTTTSRASSGWGSRRTASTRRPTRACGSSGRASVCILRRRSCAGQPATGSRRSRSTGPCRNARCSGRVAPPRSGAPSRRAPSTGPAAVSWRASAGRMSRPGSC